MCFYFVKVWCFLSVVLFCFLCVCVLTLAFCLIFENELNAWWVGRGENLQGLRGEEKHGQIFLNFKTVLNNKNHKK